MTYLNRVPNSTNGYRKSALSALVAAAFSISSPFWASAASAAASPVGVWLDHTQRGAVEIYSCGSSLCGRIVWMEKPLKASGKPVVDARNPKEALRARTICGMKMLGELRSAGEQTWEGGWIYDPERGKSFDALIKVRGDDTLTVTGYLFSPAFGKTFKWTRAPEDIGRCAPTVEAALGN